VANQLEDVGSTVAGVASAFEMAGGRAPTVRTTVVSTDAVAIDGWLRSTAWRPTHQLDGEAHRGEWGNAVVDPHCRSWPGVGYEGNGFIAGPDGRRYPLVAPHVTRNGTVYNADLEVVRGWPSVLDLDGRDTGWSTVYEQIGVERWRDAPGVAGRILAGVGATAIGAYSGSSASDVDATVLAPGRAPTLGRPLVPPTVPEPTPPQYTPPAPPDSPPGIPELEYPTGQTSLAASGTNLAPVVINGLVGAAYADLGSHDAYDITFQQNADGRIRALYRRVFVGFGDDDKPVLESVWVTGPERNDQVPIKYAPPGSG
jgi:hypothetical protein